jgi:hypothetical protein
MERRLTHAPRALLAGVALPAVLLCLLAGGCDIPGSAPGSGTAPQAGGAPPAAAGRQAARTAAPAAGAASPAAAAPGAPPTLPSFLARGAGTAPPAAAASPADGTASLTGTGALEPEHDVAPPSSAELARKRAEWAEHERMQQQEEQNLQEWRRARAPAAAAPVPKVGAAAADPDTERQEARAAMRRWYAAYSTRSSAVTLALSRYGLATAEQPPDEPRLTAACRELSRAAAAILADPRALAVPGANVSRPLATAYTEIQATAEACLGGRPDLQAGHFAAAQRALTEAAAALRPFGLAP